MDEKDQEKFVDKITSKISGFFNKEKEGGGNNNISLAEFDGVKKQLAESMDTIKKLSEIVTDKTKQFETQTKDLMLMAEKSRVDMAEAVCKGAINEGVPPAFVDQFRKVLSSDLSERTLKFSEKEGEKTVEKEISLKEIIQKSFANFPNKINLGDKTKTSLDSKSGEKEKLMKDRKLELMEKEHMSEHQALQKIAREFPEEV